MAKTQILDYYIHLSNKTVADSMNALLRAGAAGAWPDGMGQLIFVPRSDGPDTFPVTLVKGEYCIRRAPTGAAIEFAQDAALPADLPIIDTGETVPADGNYISSPWFTNSNDFDRTVAKFTRSSGWWIFGSNTTFYWAGHVVYTPAAEAAGSNGTRATEPAPIRGPRQWIDGIENHVGGDADGGNSNDYAYMGRRIGSVALVPRSNSASAQSRQHTPTGNPTSLWERFYFRWDGGYPSIEMNLWRGQVVAVAGSGGILTATPTGRLALYGHDGTSQTLIGTTQVLELLDVNAKPRWYRVDIIHTTDPSTTPSPWTGHVYIDRVLAVEGAVSISGLAGNHVLTTSLMGKQGGTSDAKYCVDDWIAAPVPYTRDPTLAAWSSITTYNANDIVRVGTSAYKSMQGGNTNHDPTTDNSSTWWKLLTDPTDWVNGWHVRHVRCTGNAASFAGWTGDFRSLAQKIAGQAGNTGFTSSTALALASFTTDLAEFVDSYPGAIGWAGFQVNAFVSAGGAPDGRLGYKIGAAASVMTAIVQGVGLEWHAEPKYPTTDIAQPQKGIVVELHHEKANDATAAVLAVLNAQVEMTGIFGPEDIPGDADPNTAKPLPQTGGAHLTPYDQSPWTAAQVPFGPVTVMTGQYVGNGTGQDLSFAVPPILLFIRPNSGATGGFRWWTSCLGPHRNAAQGTGHITSIVRPRQDFTFVSGGPASNQQMRFIVPIAGADAQINANGVTYSYLAICDPAGRFFRAGTLAGAPNTVPQTHALDDPFFLAEWAFLFKEELSQGAGLALFFKSPAHAADEIGASGGGAPTANALTIALGTLTARAGLIANDTFADYPYFLIRRDDGNAPPEASRLVQMGSYVGDGTASRTVSANFGGRRPMWALVIPHAAAQAYYRDPNNTGANSQRFDNDTNSATAITGGGIDSFSVGTTLNTNGTTYSWLVFPGCTGAGNNGWSTLCEDPIASDSPGDPDIDDPIEIEPPEDEEPPVDDEPDIEDDTPIGDPSVMVEGQAGGHPCEFYSRRIANQALRNLGSSKRIASLSTDNTLEATLARDCIREAINTTLRDHPWAFATRYQDLALVGGTATDAVNDDWQYSYRGPNRMLFARRIVPQDGKRRGPNDKPETFRKGMDADGPLIFCNAPATTDLPLVLEWTIRDVCPAFYGDPLFREAVAWRMAAEMAMPLSRDSKKQQFCLTMYYETLRRAEVPADNEQQPDLPGDADWISGRN
jgi:hypothetical protein